MERNTKRFVELYGKYLSNTASIAEEQEFFAYIEDPLYKDQVEKLLSESFANQTDFIHLKDRSRSRILNHILHKEQRKTKQPIYRKIAFRVAIAASILLCVGLSFYLFQVKEQTGAIEGSTALQADIQYLDSTQVYLTLADGRRIALSDDMEGQIAEQSGVVVTKSKDGSLVYSVSGGMSNTNAYNAIETPKGGQYQIILPDGTKVWLNAASSLKYPVSFSSLSERKVFLKGEGYFEVSKDARRPFRVMTDDRQEVEVLGTHFNINAYRKEIKTTLLEGAVKVSSLAADKVQSTVLKPGQMSINEGNKITIAALSYVANQIAWRDGYLVFNNANIKDIMADLSNWYDLEVEYQGDMSKIYFHGNYLRSRDVKKLLNSLELTNKVKFKIEGRRVIVLGE